MFIGVPPIYVATVYRVVGAGGRRSEPRFESGTVSQSSSSAAVDLRVVNANWSIKQAKLCRNSAEKLQKFDPVAALHEVSNLQQLPSNYTFLFLVGLPTGEIQDDSSRRVATNSAFGNPLANIPCDWFTKWLLQC